MYSSRSHSSKLACLSTMHSTHSLELHLTLLLKADSKGPICWWIERNRWILAERWDCSPRRILIR